jgi:hypothetical protein
MTCIRHASFRGAAQRRTRNPDSSAQHDIFCLLHGQSPKRHALSRRHKRFGSACLPAQEQDIGRIYRPARSEPARLVRMLRRSANRDFARKGTEEMATRLEACVDREDEPDLVRSLRRHMPIGRCLDSGFAAARRPGMTRNSVIQGCKKDDRHSGARRRREPGIHACSAQPSGFRVRVLRTRPGMTGRGLTQLRISSTPKSLH